MIQIRGVVDSIVFLELHCRNHMPLLATVSLQKSNSPKDANISGKISSNDVIETYRFLKDFKGSLEQIFDKEKNNKT